MQKINMSTNLPVSNAITIKKANNTANDRFMISFLLGVIYSNVSINNRYKEITISLPMSKQPLTFKLKEFFGGSCFTYTYKKSNNTYAKWQIKSKKDRAILLKAIKKVKSKLPETVAESLTSVLEG